MMMMMQNRAALDPLLPVSNPTESFWQTKPSSISSHRTTESLPSDLVDYIIIGSGITGATIAYELLLRKPDVKIVMLEARGACSGATGRNGGHTKSANYRMFKHNLHTVGREDAIKIARLEYITIKAVHAFIRQHNLAAECELRSIDSVDIFLDQDKFDDAVAAVELMQETMPASEPATEHKIWQKESAREKFMTPRALGAVSFTAGSLVPYKLVCAILQMCLDKGMNLQTNTPALSISPSNTVVIGDGCRYAVQTARGEVKARNVILATNGYTSHLYPPLRSSIVPLRGQITVHAPPAGSGLKEQLDTTYSFINKDGYDYMIQHPSTREIVIGGGLTKAPDGGAGEYGETDDSKLEVTGAVGEYLRGSVEEYFGVKGKVTKEWTGIMGYSADGYPWVGRAPKSDDDGLWMAASFQGHGMVLCFLCAKVLVEMIVGDEKGLQEWFPNCFVASEERLKEPFTGKA